MVSILGLGLFLAAGLTGGPAAMKQRPVNRPKAEVEFRWIQDRPMKDVTVEKGIRTSCGLELSYPHLQPVLRNADVAAASLKNHGSVMGLPGDHYLVTFYLTADARKKLSAESGDRPRPLAVFVDGKYWGTWYFRKSEATKFAPQAGFIPSQAEAERIVSAFD